MTRLISTLLALSLSSLGPASAVEPGTQSVDPLIGQFPNPDRVYRTTPFMVWNTSVSQYQIDNMLREFYHQGFGGVLIRPGKGLQTDYLSAQWFDMVEYTVRRARDFELDVWLYNQNSYPGGPGGEHLSHPVPASSIQVAGLIPTVVAVMPSDVSKYEVIVRQERGKLLDITAKAAKMAGKKGRFFLYEKNYYAKTTCLRDYSDVDLLHPEAARGCISMPLHRYEQALGSDLKRSVKGCFADESEISFPEGLYWTPDLFEQFQQRYGYDLRPQLPALHMEQGNWKKVRHDYLSLLLHLFVERWAKPWYNYCEGKEITWTGHYWEHARPDTQRVSDNMALAAWQQVPGIDMLFNQFDEHSPQAQFGNIRAVKEARSVANQLGRTRVLGETYGGTGWGMTFKDFKRQGDWGYVLGINQMNQHCSPMSLLGARKTDYPPFFSRSATWWGDYRLLNDYYARLSVALSMGDQINDVLIMEPTTSLWMYYLYGDRTLTHQGQQIAQRFQNLVTQLESTQFEFDLGSEEIFKSHASVHSGRFVVGERSYRVFVIPSLTENLERNSFELLKQFVAQGGTLIALGSPDLIDGAHSAELQEFLASDQVIRGGAVTDSHILPYLRNSALHFTRQQGGNLLHQRRVFREGQLLFLVNSSMDEATDVAFEIEGKDVVRMEAMEGINYKMPHALSGNKVVVSTRIEPAGSLLLMVSQTPMSAEPAPAPIALNKLMEPMRPLKIERLKENVLLIDFLDLECDGQTYRDLYFVQACDKVFQAAGFEMNPWNQAIQFGQQIIQHDMTHAPGFKATYRFTVTSEEVDLASMLMVVENPNIYTVKINGHIVRGGYYYVIDEDFKRIAIGSHVKVGLNEIEISAQHPTVLMELAAVYVLGNFNVEAQNDRWVVTPVQESPVLTHWKGMGAPFYPWEMRYSKFYDVQDASKRHFVKIDRWTGALVQVWINDSKAGVIFAEPDVLEVTSMIKPGANRVEVRVVGNLENYLGPHHTSYESSGGSQSWYGIQGLPKASEYCLTSFGLESDFMLYQE